MDMTRRTFGSSLAAAVAGLVAGGWRGVRRVSPVRVARAISARCFPGKLAPLDRRAVRRRGRWLG